ncbi:MAG: CDP-alcohol phosphatidyltransferase family protein [Oscillospiraceae bacterium]|jgi:cardiolipin synthase|nr:CDP-alcohol phosphatidyltransferase family protein [Oscillospiraceae bacterium]
MLSIFRLLLVPVFILMYFDGADYAGLRAVCVYAIAGATDVLDGMIARKYKQVTRLGRILDPLADKLMTFAVLICVTVDGVVPLWAVTVFFIKEGLMGIGGLLLYRKIADMPPSNIFGKISTVVFFIVCVILIIGKGFISELWANIMMGFAIVVTLLAFASYIFKFASIQSKVKKRDKE